MGRRFSCSDFLFILWLFSANCHIVMSAVTNDETILQSMSPCPTVKFVHNSTYTAICSEKKIDSKVNNDVDSDLEMCKLVKQIMSVICTFESKNSIKSTNKLNLPGTSQEFDNAIKALEPKPKDFNDFIEKFCTNVSLYLNKIIAIEPNDEYTVSSFKNIKTVLGKGECKFTCHKTYKVNPLCMILAWANNIFSSIKTFSSRPQELSSQKDPTLALAKSTVKATEEQSTEYQKNNNNIPEKQKSINKKEHNDKQNDIIKQEEQSVHIKPKKTDKSVDTNSNVDNSNDIYKPPNLSNDQNRQDRLNKPVEEQKEEEAIKDKPNTIVSSFGSDKEDALKQIESPASPNNSFNVAGNGQIDKIDPNEKNDENLQQYLNEQKGADTIGGQQENLGDSDQVDLLKFPQSSIAKEEEESHFFTYFSIISLLCIALYVGYHNKQKILAMVLEGRRSRRGRNSRRRPSTASYRKLDCNLEEAVTSQCNSNVTHVIY